MSTTFYKKKREKIQNLNKMRFFGKLLKTGANALTGGLASGLAGAASSIFSGIGSKKRLNDQINAQKQLNEQAAALNYKYGEKAAENAFARQLQMYERSYRDQSYAAMRKQMEDAGLSVGLMYGGSASGGAGGATSGAPLGASGGAEAGRAASETERRMMELQQAQMGLSLAGQRADIELKESQAALTKEQAKEVEAKAEEARKSAGLIAEQTITEKQKREPMIESLKEDIQNKAAERAIMGVDYRIKQVEFEIRNGTKDLEIEKLELSIRDMKNDIVKGIEEIESIQMDNEIKRKTIGTQVAIYNAKLKNLMIDLLLKDSSITVNTEQANLFAEEAEKTFVEREAIPTKMEIEYEIAELMAKTGVAQTKMSSSASLGGSLITALGLMGMGFLKLPEPRRPIGYK